MSLTAGGCEGQERVVGSFGIANIYGAPVVVVCADKSKAWTRPFDGMVTTDIDASILTDHMMFIATELGVGQFYLADKRIIDFDFLCAEFPFVIGRKNWLFARSPKGAAASADLYTLVETAKANGLDAMK